MTTAPASDALLRRVLRVADAVGAFIEYWGFKAIHGRIWAVLALHGAPMPQSEVARLLGVSRSLVSTAMSELADYGLVRPVDDHRNAPYEAVLDVWPTISEVLREREWMLLESVRQSLEAARDEAEQLRARGEVPTFDPARIVLLLNMTELAQTVLRLLISLKLPRGAEKVSGWLVRAMGMAQKLARPRLAG
jgi:DNA-binding transcriptional regulator GbsR (MarR family)